MGKNNNKQKYAIAAVITTVCVVSLFAWFIVKYLQQRPWPPELTSSSQTHNSGDTYILTWVPAKTGPQPEFYYLEESTDKNFSSSKKYTFLHDPAKSQQQSVSIVAPAVPSPSKKYYYRVLAGYKSKYFSPNDILSDPSNDVSVTVKPISDPSVMPVSTSIFSGQEYTISWTTINKANAYLLEETKPDSSITDYKLTGTSKKFLVPPLKQNGSYSYKVKAANTSGSTWVYITGWSNQENVSVKYVPAPSGLMIDPTSVHYPQQYKISWNAPSVGPSPASSYNYILQETMQSQTPKILPSQAQTSYTTQAPNVTSSTTISYEVKANMGQNPMTFFSNPVKVTINKPPAPPSPSITQVVPNLAPKGATVTITGSNLTSAKVELYSTITLKSVSISSPTTQTATKIEFKVPTTASLSTTDVRVVGGNQKSFQVARQTGSFVERQKTVQLISQTVGLFKAEVDLPPNYLNMFTGRFKEGSKILVNFPLPGFKGTNIVKSGLGFSQTGKVGVLVAETTAGIVQPAYINFYNLSHMLDNKINVGSKISGPDGIEPSLFFVEGYKLLFSPDETIGAVVNRNKPGPSNLWIYILDMLTGQNLYKNQFNNASFSLSVDKTNKISLDTGSGSPTLITIPIPQ